MMKSSTTKFMSHLSAVSLRHDAPYNVHLTANDVV